MLLVSVVGDFDSGVLPLFYYHAENIRVHILLHDAEEAEKAARLQRGLRRFCRHYGYGPLLLTLNYHEDSRQSIAETAETILTHKGSGEFLLNFTEGLSTTAVLLHGLLAPRGGVLVEYDRRENGFNLLRSGEIRSETVSPMTVEEHLMLKDVDVELHPDMRSVMARRPVVEALLADSERFMAYRNAYGTYHGNVAGYDDIKSLLTKAGVAENKNFIDGGIFEEYCFHLLNDLPFDDVQLGVVATFMPDTEWAFKNEFDVLCIKDNHLHIVECKFRNFLDGEELVYKYDSVMDLIDEDARAVLAVVGGENVRIGRSGKVKKIFSDGVKNRADHNDTLIYQEACFDPERFKAEVGAFLLG